MLKSVYASLLIYRGLQQLTTVVSRHTRDVWLVNSSFSSMVARRIKPYLLACNCQIFFFTERCYASAVYAVSVCVSVCLCLSQVSFLLKWLHVGSYKQHHWIAQGL